MVYPYVQNNLPNYIETNKFLYDVMKCLLNLVPDSDKTEAASNFTKLLYYDDIRPYSHDEPTEDQKRKLIFNPDGKISPDIEKGYRVFFQNKFPDQQVEATTEVHITPLMLKPYDSYRAVFIFSINMSCNLMRASMNNENRLWSMAQYASNVLTGRFIGGVGQIFFNNNYELGGGYLGTAYNGSDAKANESCILTLGVHFGGSDEV